MGWGHSALAGPLREHVIEIIKIVNAEAPSACGLPKYHPSAPPVLS
jgi:hypothetical protein